jgi:hypothetical protein
MGEIADSIINGDTCPCGEFLGGGEGPGFPQYCSSLCERDFGGGRVRVQNPQYKSAKEYRGEMDEGYFEAMGVEVIKHQPWQFSLLHDDLPEGSKFVWYPRKGTLMYETENGNVNVGQFLCPEDVVEEINKKINQ